MNNVYDEIDPPQKSGNVYDSFDVPTPPSVLDPLGIKQTGADAMTAAANPSIFERIRRLAATPSPEWLQAPEERARAFVQGAGVPSSLQQAKDFLLQNPIQDVKDIYTGVTQIPERVRNIRQTLETSPGAAVIRDPLSPEAFGVYGTTAGMLLPAMQKAFKGRAVEVPVPVEPPPEIPLQPNVPEGYARFQPLEQAPVETQSQTEVAPTPDLTTAAQPEPTQTVAGTQGAELYSGQRQGGPRTNWMTSDINIARQYAGDGGQIHVYDESQFPVPIEDMREDVSGEPTNAPVGTYSFHNLSGIEPIRSIPVKGGETNAIKKGNIAESSQPEYTGNAPSGTPAETGGRGGTEPTAPISQEKPVGISKAAIAAQRQARDLPDIERVKQIEFGQSLDRANEIVADDPTAPKRLVDELAGRPRALSPEETPLVIRRVQETQREFDDAVNAVNAATTDEARAASQSRLDLARDEYDRTVQTAQNTTSKTGAGLNSLKMLVNNDYSLARMESRRRAANNGKALSEKQLAEVKALHDQIAELSAKVDAHERLAKTKQSFTKIMREGREQAREAAKAKKTVTQFLDEQAAKARERIVARRGRLNVGFDPTAVTDEIIIGASHIARGVRDFGEWSRQMISDFGERIRPLLKDIFSRAQAFHNRTRREFLTPQEKRLEQYKKGLSRRTESLEARIAAGDTAKAVREQTQLDREAFRMRAEYQRTKDRFDTLVERERLKNRPALQKAADTFVKAERALKLTGITTLGKLGAAGVTRLASTPVEEAVGAVLSKLPILSRVAKAAPREGGFNITAEIKAPTVGVARGIRNIPKVLKGERTNEEALYGKRGTNEMPIVSSALDIPGRIHGVLKSPIKEAERVRSQTKWEAYARKKGMDLSDPAVQQQIGEAAHQDALRSIFLQDNIFSTQWNLALRSLESSKKFPVAGKVISTVGRFLLPIVKVPTNIALETGTHLFGTATATGKLMAVMARGLKTIRPEEADMIMRHYKKGTIGIGLFLTGYFNADKLGGFYQEHEKRKPTDVQWGEARIAGVTVPRWLMHAPAFIVMQAGATANRVSNQVVKKTGRPQGPKAATLAVAEGLTHEIPFINEMGIIDSLLGHGWEGESARGRLLQSTVVPIGVKNIAEWMDTQKRRYPQNELDYIKMAVPGLREQVPYAKPNR